MLMLHQYPSSTNVVVASALIANMQGPFAFAAIGFRIGLSVIVVVVSLGTIRLAWMAPSFHCLTVIEFVIRGGDEYVLEPSSSVVKWISF